MNPNQFDPINVLNIFRGFDRPHLKYHITPYRILKQNGESLKVEEIRHFHQDYKGGHKQYHYHIKCTSGTFCRLLFDSGTFTWRMVEEKQKRFLIHC